jgi:hypothetical protein
MLIPLIGGGGEVPRITLMLAIPRQKTGPAVKAIFPHVAHPKGRGDAFFELKLDALPNREIRKAVGKMGCALRLHDFSG